MGKPTIKDIVDLNRAVKMLKDTADCPHPKLTWESCTVGVFADSSFANTNQMKSQCGYIIGLTIPEIKDGGEAPFLMVEANSGSIKRVCRSTFNGFLQGSEAGDYLRSILVELKNPGRPLRELESEFGKPPMVAITDAKSLESTIVKDAGQPSDKRVKLLVAQVKEMLGYTDYEDGNQQVIWCDTSQMLADVLTKSGCEREPLLQVMDTCVWRLQPSEEARVRKLMIRAGRRKTEKRSQTFHDCEAKEASESDMQNQHEGSAFAYQSALSLKEKR